MNLEVTQTELDTINSYRNEKYSNINQFLSQDVETDISLLMSGESIDYSRQTVIENIESIKKIYEAIEKSSYTHDEKEWEFYRIVNVAEINRLKAETNINRFLLASENENNAKNNLPTNISRYVLMKICGNNDVSYIKLSENIDEIVISPFTEVLRIEENNQINNNHLKIYKVFCKSQELKSLTEDEEKVIYNSIIDNADMVNQKLKECMTLESENTTNFENIRKLEQLLINHNQSMEQENYENDNTESEKQANLDDIARINNELSAIKSTVVDIFDKRKENLLFVTNWKKDVIKYMMSECKKIKDTYKEEEIEEKVNESNNENVENNEGKKYIEVSDNMEEIGEIEKIEKAGSSSVKRELDSEVSSVKLECQENIAMVDTLLTNIKNLIYKQQNHARIAELIDSNYKALNNAFEMKNYAEQLESFVNAISNKVDTLTAKNSEELQKISKTNIQVSTLLNYLNNPKSAVSKRINRFEELSILEENELKREIAETIKNIRCEAELKKLRDDLDIIEERSGFKKFLGKFTGRNKLNEAMVEQIGIRQTAIRKTFKVKMPLAKNYSIHSMIAEIEMFIADNSDDELVIDDVSTLRNIRDVLKKNFVIIDSKVISIIDQKTGKNLPFESRKLSKKELIEIDTYRFLNKYGYDRAVEIDEPEYQDTLASEIKMIVDYIKTSEIL